MKLDVYNQNRMVGVLEQTEINKYVFTYAPNTDPGDRISLLMPVRTESWVHYGSLHPIFQVSLPEGALRSVLERKYAKFFDRFGDMELLSTIGAHLIGRLKIVPSGHQLDAESPSDGLDVLLAKGAHELLDQFMDIRAQYSGVSGAFPKVLSKSPIGRSAAADRSTLVFDRWIVKTSSKDNPGLVLNEYFGLRLAHNVGLTVPEYILSDDAQRLLIRRFDIDDEGNSIGFEDMCALAGLPANEKFSGSFERIVKTVNEMCSPRAAAVARDALYLQYVACMAMRNGDAHMKNFGLIYEDPDDPKLSPAYDMVTMCAYAPCAEDRDALDMPALTFGGVRRWPNEKAIKAMAGRCLVGASRQKAISSQLAQGFIKTAQEMACYAQENDVEDRPIIKRMIELWSCGIKVHDEQASQTLCAIADGIDLREDSEPVYIKPERVRY